MYETDHGSLSGTHNDNLVSSIKVKQGCTISGYDNSDQTGLLFTYHTDKDVMTWGSNGDKLTSYTCKCQSIVTCIFHIVFVVITFIIFLIGYCFLCFLCISDCYWVPFAKLVRDEGAPSIKQVEGKSVGECGSVCDEMDSCKSYSFASDQGVAGTKCWLFNKILYGDDPLGSRGGVELYSNYKKCSKLIHFNRN